MFREKCDLLELILVQYRVVELDVGNMVDITGYVLKKLKIAKAFSQETFC